MDSQEGWEILHLAPHTGEKPQLALYVFFIPLTFSNYILLTVAVNIGKSCLYCGCRHLRSGKILRGVTIVTATSEIYTCFQCGDGLTLYTHNLRCRTSTRQINWGAPHYLANTTIIRHTLNPGHCFTYI